MTKGYDLLRAAIEEKIHSNVKYLKKELFTEEELFAYKLFDSYYLESGGEIPPMEFFLREGIRFPEPITLPGEKTSFLYNYGLVVKRQKSQAFINFVDEAKFCRDLDKQKELTENYLSYLNKFNLYQNTFSNEEIIGLSWEKYQRNKELQKKGKLLGVSSGWRAFDELIHYYQPGNLYIFSGRRNLGKSYLIARQVLKALIDRMRVMLVSMEMTAEEFADRFAAIQCRINPDDIMQGRLSLADEEKFLTTKENFDQYDLRIVEGNFDKKIVDLIAEIKEYHPDIVFIDGSYMLQPDNKYLKSDWEKQGHIHELLKTALALECNLPVVCTVQEKRGRKGIDEGTVSRSDMIESVASVLVSIQHVKGNDHRRLLDIIKNRHGKPGSFIINFNFSDMDMDINDEDTQRHRENRRNGNRAAAQNQHMQNLNAQMR